MNYIGIFDSGVGGLGIFNEIKKLLPSESILYLADTANCPYGKKSQESIKEICKKNTEFLIEQGAKIIVVACNTASVSALNYLRSEFPGIPIVGVIPVVKTAAEISKNKRIGLLATKTTLNSDYLKGLIKEFCPPEKGFRMYFREAGELVEAVEKIYHLKDQDIEKKVKRNVGSLVFNGVDVIILGCTHFPFLRDQIEKTTGGKIKILDSNGAVARQIARILKNNNQLTLNNLAPEYKFFCTKDKGIFKYLLQTLANTTSDKIYLLKWN